MLVYQRVYSFMGCSCFFPWPCWRTSCSAGNHTTVPPRVWKTIPKWRGKSTDLSGFALQGSLGALSPRVYAGICLWDIYSVNVTNLICIFEYMYCIYIYIYIYVQTCSNTFFRPANLSTKSCIVHVAGLFRCTIYYINGPVISEVNTVVNSRQWYLNTPWSKNIGIMYK